MNRPLISTRLRRGAMVRPWPKPETGEANSWPHSVPQGTGFPVGIRSIFRVIPSARLLPRRPSCRLAAFHFWDTMGRKDGPAMFSIEQLNVLRAAEIDAIVPDLPP